MLERLMLFSECSRSRRCHEAACSSRVQRTRILLQFSLQAIISMLPVFALEALALRRFASGRESCFSFSSWILIRIRLFESCSARTSQRRSGEKVAKRSEAKLETLLTSVCLGKRRIHSTRVKSPGSILTSCSQWS